MSIEEYKAVQRKAKSVLNQLGKFITPDSTETSIVEKAIELFKREGVSETWYHGVLAFVLLGDRSVLSMSGRDYAPADSLVGNKNVVSVDLSPKVDGIWGDCARTFFVEDGRVTPDPTDPEFVEGQKIQQTLHYRMRNFCLPKTRFCDLYDFANELIQRYGYENLDFNHNLGHSIEKHLDQRVYIEAGNTRTLGSVKLFTFEPHIRKIGRNWGIKHENIYCFNEMGDPVEL